MMHLSEAVRMLGAALSGPDAEVLRVSTDSRSIQPGDLFIALMSFGLEASAKVTQVLFFKFHKNDTKIENNAGKATINAMVLAALRPAISQKLVAHAADYVGQLEI